jgi:hypothetical protein
MWMGRASRIHGDSFCAGNAADRADALEITKIIRRGMHDSNKYNQISAQYRADLYPELEAPLLRWREINCIRHATAFRIE